MSIDNKHFRIDHIHEYEEKKQIIYGEMEYQTDTCLSELIKTSYYFFDNFVKYHKQEKIYLQKEPIDITESAFKLFISICQGENLFYFDIFNNNEIIFQLYYLSIKYKVTGLTKEIYDYISKNNQKLVIELLKYKTQIQNLPNYDELKLNFDEDNEINFISSNLIYFINNDKDNFSSLPINILYSILAKYFEQKEFRIEISDFLFHYLDNSDKNACVLFSLIKFNIIDDLIPFEEKLIQLKDKFDFNFLNCESIVKTHYHDRKSLKNQLQEKDQKITQLEELISVCHS